MRCLVVLAHPLAQSLNHHFAETAKTELEAAGHAVTLLDLHAEGFDPRLSATERAAYHNEHAVGEDAERHVHLLRSADALVLVFPVWWFGPPAILKGWIDRVFAPGVAFDHAPDFGPIRPLLAGLRQVLVVNTFGTPWWVDRLVMGRPVRRMLKRAVIGACAPRASFDYLALHAAEQVEPARLARFETRLRARLARLSGTSGVPRG